MRISGRKYAITGAGRGLGAALALVMADAGAELVLLARSRQALGEITDTIRERTGRIVDVITCDLADLASSRNAGEKLADEHGDLDGIILNGAMWLPGSMGDINDEDIHACIASAAIGSLILTRHVLPNLIARSDADIHTIISTSGLPSVPLGRVSVAFRAAKSAQSGFVQGLMEELKQTGVRVSAVYPGNFEDVSPLEPAWSNSAQGDGLLSNREVAEAVMFILNLPHQVRISSLVIE